MTPSELAERDQRYAAARTENEAYCAEHGHTSSIKTMPQVFVDAVGVPEPRWCVRCGIPRLGADWGGTGYRA